MSKFYYPVRSETMKHSKFEVRKQERESNQSLIRRFTRRLKNSGILTAAKKSQFRRPEPSEKMRKQTVLRKIEKQKERERQKKLGII